MGLKFNPLGDSFDFVKELSGYVPYTGATQNVNIGSYKYTQDQSALGTNYFGLSNISGMRVTNAIEDGTGGYYFFLADDSVGTVRFDPRTGVNVEMRFDGTDGKVHFDNPIVIDQTVVGDEPAIEVTDGSGTISIRGNTLTTTNGSASAVVTPTEITGSPTITMDKSEQDTPVLIIKNSSTQMTGVIENNSDNGTWVGTNTLFAEELELGDVIIVNTINYTVTNIGSNTALTTSPVPPVFDYNQYNFYKDITYYYLNSEGMFESGLTPNLASTYSVGTSLKPWSDGWFVEINNKVTADLLSEGAIAYTHVTDTGNSHTYINQPLNTLSSPTFSDVSATSVNGGAYIQGLKAHYLFNGDLTDDMLVYDGAEVGTLSYASGKVGQAVETSLYNSCLLPATSFDAHSQGAIACWIHPTSYSDTYDAIFGVGSDSNYFYILLSGGKLSLDIKEDSGALAYLEGSSTLSLDTDYHIVVKSDGSTIKMYVNGVEESLTLTFGTNHGQWISSIIKPSYDSSYYIGAVTTSTVSHPFTGWIDDFRIYDQDLSTGAIAAIYNGGSGTESNYIPSELTLNGSGSSVTVTEAKTAYDHSQLTTGNPHSVTASEVVYRDGESVYEILDESINPGILHAFNVSDDGGLDISWSAGEIIDFSGNIVQVSAGSGTCTDNSMNYLVWVSGSTLTLRTTSSSDDEIPVAQVACQAGDIWGMTEEPQIDIRVHYIQHGLGELAPVLIADGMIIADSGALTVEQTAGEIYLDAHQEIPVSALDSSTTPMRRWYHSSGVWTSETNSSIDTEYYDDGTNKAAATVGKYFKALFFSSPTEIHWIYPNAQYNNIADAINASPPQLPTGLVKMPRTASVVYKKGDTDFSSAIFTDLRPMLGISSGTTIPSHNGLAGLQGGTGDEYYHLTSARHSQVVTGLTRAWDVTVTKPTDFYAIDTQMPVAFTTAAITVTKIVVSTNTAAQQVLGDLKWADNLTAFTNATVINDFDTTSGVRTDTTITSANVAAGKYVYLQLDSAPNAAVTWMTVHIEWVYQ